MQVREITLCAYYTYKLKMQINLFNPIIIVTFTSHIIDGTFALHF